MDENPKGKITAKNLKENFVYEIEFFYCAEIVNTPMINVTNLERIRFIFDVVKIGENNFNFFNVLNYNENFVFEANVGQSTELPINEKVIFGRNFEIQIFEQKQKNEKFPLEIFVNEKLKETQFEQFSDKEQGILEQIFIGENFLLTILVFGDVMSDLMRVVVSYVETGEVVVEMVKFIDMKKGKFLKKIFCRFGEYLIVFEDEEHGEGVVLMVDVEGKGKESLVELRILEVGRKVYSISGLMKVNPYFSVGYYLTDCSEEADENFKGKKH